MVLSKEGANLPMFTADNSEEPQDKWKKKRGGTWLRGLITGFHASGTKEKINYFSYFLNIRSHFSIYASTHITRS